VRDVAERSAETLEEQPTVDRAAVS
jgi:hypothetical protein